MARVTIDGKTVEAPEGAPLVEVIKRAGVYISNLCYINGLPPYAGCRTCLVEIKGARGLQLSCTTRVSDGMVVRVDIPAADEARKAALSIIMANHPDRCLTCHRVVKCRAGDTCLRDNVVTHRCVTCSKNYRCELQTTCDRVGMANYEPWIAEERSYYMTEPPPADRGNPFLEFDPQMCILCARCVRACDEIRHTGAITVAGRGWETRIAFGAGGPVHESNCDFCGACIDLCPTATLMEHPNKWAATNVEKWTPTTCAYCSVGCTINVGSRRGRGVIVRPEPSNPVSNDQICVRGRFHYDAVKRDDFLSRPMVRRNGALEPASWEEALTVAVERLVDIRQQHGPQAIGFLGSPFATTEENYLLQKLARAVMGTNNLDYSGGAVPAAVDQALERAFGSQVLPADMARLAQCRTILVVADDLESSHNVACLRIKDAVVRQGARLIVVAPRRGELCDFAQVWLQPTPGQEAQVLAALTQGLLGDQKVGRSLEVPAYPDGPAPSGDMNGDLGEALAILANAAHNSQEDDIAIVYAVPHLGPQAAETITAALSNLAIIGCGPERAARCLYILPSEVNVNGLRDVGVAPDMLPGYRPVADEAARRALAQVWGTFPPAAAGLDFQGMMAAAATGHLKALVVLGDNPLFFAPDKEWVRQCLGYLELLVAIDGLPSDTARMAHIVLPDVSLFAKEGTYTNADHRVLRLRAAVVPAGEARPALHILADLGQRLAERLSAAWIAYADAEAVMDEIAKAVPLYGSGQYHAVHSGAQQKLDSMGPKRASIQPLPQLALASAHGDLILITGRTLYTSLEGATIHSPEADKLHREEFAELSPQDADRLGIGDGDEITIAGQRLELTLHARITTDVRPGTVFVPLYYDGGAVTALLDRSDGVAPLVKATARSPHSTAGPAA